MKYCFLLSVVLLINNLNCVSARKSSKSLHQTQESNKKSRNSIKTKSNSRRHLKNDTFKIYQIDFETLFSLIPHHYTSRMATENPHSEAEIMITKKKYSPTKNKKIRRKRTSSELQYQVPKSISLLEYMNFRDGEIRKSNDEVIETSSTTSSSTRSTTRRTTRSTTRRTTISTTISTKSKTKSSTYKSSKKIKDNKDFSEKNKAFLILDIFADKPPSLTTKTSSSILNENASRNGTKIIRKNRKMYSSETKEKSMNLVKERKLILKTHLFFLNETSRYENNLNKIFNPSQMIYRSIQNSSASNTTDGFTNLTSFDVNMIKKIKDLPTYKAP